MKLNNTLKILLIIFIIFLYHYYIQTGLEKIFSQTYFKYDDINRPTKKCNKNNNKDVSCVGVPSGHAETVTIITHLLYEYNFIPLWIHAVSIVAFSLQRVIINEHTIEQVCIGVIFGLIYAYIYFFFHLSIYAFIIVFLIGGSLSILSIHKLDSLVNSPIPVWVDKSMITSIHKKQNIPFYLKILSVYSNAILQNRTFLSWRDLEIYLDDLINIIETKNIQYDAVVGIKTGGAIISDYVSNKLKLPNYKVKLSKTEYNCNKKPIHTINDVVNRQVLNNYGEYSLCEGIDDDLKGKNIILIDEMVSSGKTMNETIKYLRNEKHVNVIQPTCISFSKEKFKYDYKIDYILPTLVFIWPWGYDN